MVDKSIFGVAILRSELSRFAQVCGVDGRGMALDLFSKLAFTLKTVFKALDRDLYFVQCYIWGHTPTFCAHVIVSNLLFPL